MANKRNPDPRNPMAADTDPTDEELQLVMLEARDAALERKRASDDWMRQRLAAAVAEARARMQAG